MPHNCASTGAHTVAVSGSIREHTVAPGRQPPVLAGREPVLQSFDVVRRRAEEHGEGDRAWVLNGLRGVGKTVLLNEAMRKVADRGWICAKVETNPAQPLAVSLGQALIRSMRTATGRHAVPRLRRLLGVFNAFSLSLNKRQEMRHRV